MADFFTKSVRDLVLEDVWSLFAERVQENIRLEYKRELSSDALDFSGRYLL